MDLEIKTDLGEEYTMRKTDAAESDLEPLIFIDPLCIFPQL